MRSAGSRFFIVGLLALFMFIPLFFAAAIINERADYSRSTALELGREWGGAQVLSGPQLRVPVFETVTRKERVEVLDPVTREPALDEFGRIVTREIDREDIVERAPLFILPELLDLEITQESEVRARGIFEVPVYRAGLVAAIAFDLSEVSLPEALDVDWGRAELAFSTSSNRAFRGEAVLTQGGETLRLAPREGGGLTAQVGDPREASAFELRLGVQGAERLSLTPTGALTRVTLESDWPHPSFDGAFLPDGSEVRADGFSATWTIPGLARALPQVSREDQLDAARQSAFGFRFYQPNDFYQKAYRAGRYGILFIGLTFLAVLLIEDRARPPAHPVQYVMIGLVESLFVVIMVAYAEQIGFGAAYLLASAATVGLISFYAGVGLKMGRRAWVLGAVLTLLYGLLFVILQTADFALLAGASLAFAALAGTMWATRNEEWYGPEGPKPWGWRRKGKAAAS